jgi:hypothetical protein
VSYVVNVEVCGPVLLVDAEDADSGQRWKGEFSSQCESLIAIHNVMS